MVVAPSENAPVSSGGGSNGRPRPAPAPAKPPVKTYLVQSGDTLTSIAKTLYDDAGKWEKIYDANRNILRSPKSLNIGQTLVIPK